MPVNEIIEKGVDKMKKTVAATQREFSGIRTGRANPMILDSINAEYYGTPTPIRQLANVAVQEGHTLVITPYDKTIIAGIEKSNYEIRYRNYT